MRIKPVADRQVPDPERGGIMPAEGRVVEANQFWLRRIEDGDVVVVPDDDEAALSRPASKKQGA